MTFLSVMTLRSLVFLPLKTAPRRTSVSLDSVVSIVPRIPIPSSTRDISAVPDVHAFESDVFRPRFHDPRSWRGGDGALLGSSQPGIDQSLHVSDFRVDGVPKATDVLPVFPTDGLRWILRAEEGRHAAVERSLYQVENARHANANGGQWGFHDD